MSMQITVDPAGLTKEQREAVAGFILAFPAGGKCGGACDHTHGATELDADAAKLNALAGPGAAGPTFAEMGMAIHADPAAAFGVPPPPLDPAAAFAPFTAAAVPSMTAPAAPLVPTSTQVPSAPVQPAATPASAAQTAVLPTASPVAVDSAGMPWDAHIHAQNKATVKDGTWRKAKNVDAALVTAVEAELRTRVAQAAAFGVPVPQAPAPGSTLSTQPWPFPDSVPFGEQLARAAQAPLPPPPPADPAASYVALVGKVSAAIGAKRLTAAEASQCCTDSGVNTLQMLVTRPDLVPTVAAKIDAILAVRP